MPRRPLDVLENSLGDPVSVRLKDGTRYEGVLAGFDQHLNLVLESVSIGSPEGGASEGTADDDPGEDTMVIRGDNVVSITP